MRLILSFFILALLTANPARGEVTSHKKQVEPVVVDSLAFFLQAGDSCMQQFNTFEALRYYQQAYAKNNQPQNGIVCGMQHQGCAYRLGVVCVDTKRYPEGLNYLARKEENPTAELQSMIKKAEEMVQRIEKILIFAPSDEH